MRNIIKKVIVMVTALFFTVIQFGTYQEVDAASGQKAVGMYRDDSGSGTGWGIAKSGPMVLQACASYTNNGLYSNGSVNNFFNYCYYNDVVFVNAKNNTGDGTINLSASAFLTGNNVRASSYPCNAKLVYLSANKSGKTNSTYGNIGSQLVSKGATSVIAFNGYIYSTTDSDGINKFNEMVTGYMAYGTSLFRAIPQAMQYMYDTTGQYWGSETCTFYGSGALTL